MRVLVTGGSGRFGGYVLRELQRAGHTVSSYGRTPPPTEGVVFAEGAIGSLPDLNEALRGQDAVVHLAAVAHPRRASPEELMQVNVIGTFNILEAAVRGGVGKVVFASVRTTPAYR